jgi:hypothetical protein
LNVTPRLILACLVLAPTLAAAQTTREIFRIERSRSKSIVRYDARLGKDGQLDPKTPVIVYRQGTDGKTWPVKPFDFKFFYGFSVHLDKSGKFWHLSIAAAKKRPMRLYLVDGQPRAEGRIAGVAAYVKKFYVKFKDDTLIPGVSYVDLVGTDVKTGATVSERVVP